MLERGFFPELDPDLVSRLGDVAADIGRAYFAKAKRSKSLDDRMHLSAIAGTYFRRAAANSLLLGNHANSSKLFRSASRSYGSAGMAYSVMMKVLSGDRKLDAVLEVNLHSPQSVYSYLLMQATALKFQAPDRIQRWRYHLDDLRGTRLGIFAFPIDLYLDLIDALQVAEGESHTYVARLRRALLPFFETYSQALSRAKRDQFHWKRLIMPFHPVEPDIISVAVITARAVTRRRLTPSSLLEGMPLSHEAYDVLAYCMRTIGMRPKRRTEMH